MHPASLKQDQYFLLNKFIVIKFVQSKIFIIELNAVTILLSSYFRLFKV